MATRLLLAVYTFERDGKKDVLSRRTAWSHNPIRRSCAILRALLLTTRLLTAGASCGYPTVANKHA